MCLVVAALALLPVESGSQPFDPVGAHHVGLAAPAAALFRGADAVYHNPASLVWQRLTFGGGFQPVQWTKPPQSWWLSFYNSNSEYDLPISLIAQGWAAERPDGKRYVNMVGLPVAFNFTPATPGAATIKFAAEQNSSGKMTYLFPFDFGFLARHPSGAILGLVFRNVTIGPNRSELLKERLDYGVAYGGGLLTLYGATTIREENRLRDLRDIYRFGAEAQLTQSIALRGGYIREWDDWYATGGVGLRTPGERQFEFSYSLLFDPRDNHLRHFVQYIFLIAG